MRAIQNHADYAGHEMHIVGGSSALVDAEYDGVEIAPLQMQPPYRYIVEPRVDHHPHRHPPIGA